MEYLIRRADALDSITHDWHAAPWDQAATLSIANFHARSSDHHPRVEARLVYDDKGIGVIYRVEDQYVRSVRTQFQDSVCRDSCVELFVEPVPGKGYFNFEFNCAGVLLLFHVVDPTPTGNGFKDATDVADEHAKAITILPSLSGPIDPEISDPVSWTLAARIPWILFEPYVGLPETRSGTRMRANLYKCADETSKPHWACWAPIGDELNFHQPRYFGTLVLE